MELDVLYKKFGLENGPIADSPNHMFCHDFTDDIHRGHTEHQHRMFPEAEKNNRYDYLENMLNFLIDRQKNAALRLSDLDDARVLAEKNRVEVKGEVLPTVVQTALDNFDLRSDFISQSDASKCLNEFKQYSQQSLNINLELLMDYAEKMLKKNWDVLYNKRIILCGEALLSTTEEKQIEFYESILVLRLDMLNFKKTSGLFGLFYQSVVRNRITAIASHDLSDENLDVILWKIDKAIYREMAKNINNMSNCYILFFSTILTALSYCLNNKEDISPVRIFSIFTIAALLFKAATVGANYLVNPAPVKIKEGLVEGLSRRLRNDAQ